ncbi:MAG: hypothetical protein ABI376_11210, partial [Caulobacteraceae bacterium]
FVAARLALGRLSLTAGDPDAAEAFVAPIAVAGNPEALWRMAEVFAARGEMRGAARAARHARRGFEILVDRHELAWAPTAIPFFMTSGGEPWRALTLARANLANGGALRGHELAFAAATAAGCGSLAGLIAERGRAAWGRLPHFAASPLNG